MIIFSIHPDSFLCHYYDCTFERACISVVSASGKPSPDSLVITVVYGGTK